MLFAIFSLWGYRCDDVTLRKIKFSLGDPQYLKLHSGILGGEPLQDIEYNVDLVARSRSWCFKRYADLGFVLVASRLQFDSAKGNDPWLR